MLGRQLPSSQQHGRNKQTDRWQNQPSADLTEQVQAGIATTQHQPASEERRTIDPLAGDWRKRMLKPPHHFGMQAQCDTADRKQHKSRDFRTRDQTSELRPFRYRNERQSEGCDIQEQILQEPKVT